MLKKTGGKSNWGGEGKPKKNLVYNKTVDSGEGAL